jgi:hypothetical protein
MNFPESSEGDVGFSCNGESGMTTSAVPINSGMESDDKASLPRRTEQFVSRPLELRPTALSVEIQTLNRNGSSSDLQLSFFSEMFLITDP